MNIVLTSNSIKSIADFINKLPALHLYLKNAGNYYAHTSGDKDLAAETLEEHVSLVNEYFKKLSISNKIDKVVNKLIIDIIGSTNVELKTANFVKKLFVSTIVYHDYGKINEGFQVEKMSNPLFIPLLVKNSPISSSHSSLSAFLYLTRHLDDIAKNFNQSQQPILVACCLVLSYSIFKHHSSTLDDNTFYTVNFAELQTKYPIEELRSFLKTYLQYYQLDIHPNIIKRIGDYEILKNIVYNQYINSFSIYTLCKLNFSLLTASDYLATNEYNNKLPIDNFGVLTKERINELHKNISQREWINQQEGKKNYNKSAYDILEKCELLNPKIISGSNLNVLRQEMAIEVIRNIQKFHDQNLFYIEAPTGGGKTNLSILATIELLKKNEGELNKVFYVFPFTTLITQTYKVVQETLGLHDDEIIELHSKAGFKEKHTDELENDAKYGNEKLNYINNLFVNYPFCLLSHIRFFDVLKSNEKGANYLLHRLANSVVIIDELQSYNPAHWDKIIYFIKQYANKFNIKFVLMSATLPKLDKLEIIKKQTQDFIYLLPKAKELFFQNPNFLKRVDFNFDFFERQDLTLKELADKVVHESEEYAQYDQGVEKPKGSVYTIVEFIYKQSTSDFFEVIFEYDFFDKIFVLSGTILEHRRKEIINYLKNKSNRKNKVLLITTQVVEAGVDIDMDLGFKDRSLIDSDEQLAGRINRNVNKHFCKLFLFNYNKESMIYGEDKRYKLTKKIKIDEYKRILLEKDFDTLYNLVIDDRNTINSKELLQNFSNYEEKIRQLKFKTIHDDFKLIEHENISCFIPLNVPIKIYGVTDDKFDDIFNESELKFLAANRIYPTDENEISGKQVFDLYLDSIHNRIEFTQHQIRKKFLQSILSKYVISIFHTMTMKQKLIHFIDMEKSDYGYEYLQRWEEVYSIEKGMNALKLGGIEETQFL